MYPTIQEKQRGTDQISKCRKRPTPNAEKRTGVERVRRSFERKVDLESTVRGSSLYIVRTPVSGAVHSRPVDVGHVSGVVRDHRGMNRPSRDSGRDEREEEGDHSDHLRRLAWVGGGSARLSGDGGGVCLYEG